VQVVCEPNAAKAQVMTLLRLAEPFVRHGVCPLKTPKETRETIIRWCDAHLGAWAKVTGRPPRTDFKRDWLVTQAYFRTFDELHTKKTDPNFYRAHVATLDAVVRSLAESTCVRSCSEQSHIEQPVSLSSALMQALAHGGAALLQTFCHQCGCKFEKSIYGSNVRHHRDMYQTIMLLWHGTAFQDTWAVVAMIRQAIEVRIRHAFDIMGVVVNGRPTPVPLLDIMDAMKKVDGIEYELPLHTVRRIYQWANLYVHTGFKEYPWLIGYAIEYLRVLMCGFIEEDGSWSVDNAIRVPAEARKRVYDKLILKYKKKPTDDVKVYCFGLRQGKGEIAERLMREMAKHSCHPPRKEGQTCENDGAKD